MGVFQDPIGACRGDGTSAYMTGGLHAIGDGALIVAVPCPPFPSYQPTLAVSHDHYLGAWPNSVNALDLGIQRAHVLSHRPILVALRSVEVVAVDPNGVEWSGVAYRVSGVLKISR